MYRKNFGKQFIILIACCLIIVQLSNINLVLNPHCPANVSSCSPVTIASLDGQDAIGRALVQIAIIIIATYAIVGFLEDPTDKPKN